MSSTADSQVRVKVYQLEEGSKWVDRGTGFCSLEDYQGILHLNVASETQPSHLILDCVVQQGEVYQKQEATLIVWTEPTGEDLALSFQEEEGCLMILNQIAEFESVMNEHAAELTSPNHEAMLPQPTMSTLGEIERMIAEAGQSLYRRDKIVAQIVNEDYFGQLHKVHERCEDMGALSELYTIYSIARRIILLNDSSIFEFIIRDENIIPVVAMFEYDPQHPVQRGTYRNFLDDRSRYREVVPIQDPAMQAKIHQTYRLQYLKDVVLPRVLDEGTLPIINALIFFNHAQIANYIQQNHVFLKELFDILHESNDIDRKHSVVQFVHQFCTLAKSLPVSYRVGLYRTLSQHGLFAIFEFALLDDKLSVRVAGADVLMSVLELDRALVRSYALAQIRQQRENTTLLSLIIQCTKRDIGTEIQTQCCEILRIILDTMPPPVDTFELPPDIGIGGQTDRETEDFLALFYDSYIFKAMEPLLNLTASDVELINAHDKRANLFLFLCELLSFLVKHHSFRARYFIFSSDISKHAALLLNAKPKCLKLAALRFIRSCIGLQDDTYNKYLIGHRLLDPVVSMFVSVCPRDNLITSACRELFKFVAKCRISSLLAHFLGVHASALERTPEVLLSLQQAYSEYLYEQEHGVSGAPATPTVDTARRSAVSINMLAGHDSAAVSPAPNTRSAPDNGTGLWRSSVTDEVEDAYFNDIEDADGHLEPIEAAADAASSSKDTRPDGDSDAVKPAVASSSTSLDAEVAETLRKESGDGADQKPANKSQGNGSSAPSSPSIKNKLDGSATPQKSNGNSSESRSATPFKHRSSANCNFGDGTSRNNGMANGHMSIAQAFPDSKPISRKLGPKPLLRRGDSQSQIKIVLPAPSRALPKASGISSSPAEDNQKATLGKRHRQPKSSGKRLGKANGAQYSSNGDGDALSADSTRSLVAKELLSDEIAGTRLTAVSCSQSSSSVGLVSPESQAPPKKAKTATL